MSSTDNRRRVNDPSFTRPVDSNRDGTERFWTEAWLTHCLIRNISLGGINTVWDPAAGRGDLIKEFEPHGVELLASDIDMGEFDPSICEHAEGDFLMDDALFQGFGQRADMIVMNPPFKKPLPMKFFYMAATLMAVGNVQVVAMLQRSNWGNALSRGKIMDVGRGFNFAAEIKVHTRPRWDWHLSPAELAEAKAKTKDGKLASPRHYFSWFVWDKRFKGERGEIFFDRKAGAPLDEDDD